MDKEENPIDLSTLGVIDHENFFLFTRATFTQCEIPKGAPDYISEGGSCYWHRKDAKGDFVIRKSDHWCQYHIEGERTMKRLRARIRSCSWDLIIMGPLSDTEIIRFGKCYLQDFNRIRWKTKRRYDVIE